MVHDDTSCFMVADSPMSVLTHYANAISGHPSSRKLLEHGEDLRRIAEAEQPLKGLQNKLKVLALSGRCAKRKQLPVSVALHTVGLQAY